MGDFSRITKRLTSILLHCTQRITQEIFFRQWFLCNSKQKLDIYIEVLPTSKSISRKVKLRCAQKTTVFGA